MRKHLRCLCLTLAMGATGVMAAPAPATQPRPNTVPDLLLPPETQWNHFSPQRIPDFTMPTRFDPILGTNMPVKAFIWQNLGRNMFRTVTNGTEKEMFDSERIAMFKKGITAIHYCSMRSKTEQLQTGADPTKNDGLPLNSLTQVVIGEGCGNDSAFKDDWDKWIAWWRQNVDGAAGPLGAVRPGKPTPIYLTLPDYEATYQAGDSQDGVNHMVVGTYAMLDRSAGYVGQMYLGPLTTIGYVTEDIYTGGSKTAAWFQPSDDAAPEPYRGKKIEGNPRIVAGTEVSHYYETWLPEGAQVQDQNGKDWFVATHFGKAPNVEHWAARVGGLSEGYVQYTRPAGQKFILLLKACADRGNSFQYSPNQDAKRWIKEYNRFGQLEQGPNNTEVLISTGSESVTPFGAEGQVLLAYFSGVDGIDFWGAMSYDFYPRPKAGNPQRGGRYNDPTYGNCDREPYTYTLKALWRLAQPAKLEDGRKLSFYDICDGNEEYVNFNTQVSYDGGKTFKATRALDWQLEKRTAVRAVVNRKQKVIFILAFQPYGVEQPQVVVKYDRDGYKFRQKLDVPAGKIVIRAYRLDGPSSSNAKGS